MSTKIENGKAINDGLNPLKKNKKELEKLLEDNPIKDLVEIVQNMKLPSTTQKIEELKNIGFDFDIQDGEGKTFLMNEAINGDIKKIEMLINLGVDLDKQDKEGNTALMLALHNGNYDIAKKLIKEELLETKETMRMTKFNVIFEYKKRKFRRSFSSVEIIS